LDINRQKKIVVQPIQAYHFLASVVKFRQHSSVHKVRRISLAYNLWKASVTSGWLLHQTNWLHHSSLIFTRLAAGETVQIPYSEWPHRRANHPVGL